MGIKKRREELWKWFYSHKLLELKNIWKTYKIWKENEHNNHIPTEIPNYLII